MYCLRSIIIFNLTSVNTLIYTSLHPFACHSLVSSTLHHQLFALLSPIITHTRRDLGCFELMKGQFVCVCVCLESVLISQSQLLI